MTSALETWSAVLAVVVFAGAVALVVARLLAGSSPAIAALGARVVARRNAVTFAVATTAMLGSLYFSEIADYIPCRLCWFQRIAMYPIAVVALVAMIRRDAGGRWYALPMAVIGAGISTYHFLIERGVLPDSESCALFGPACSVTWFEEFGFVTLAVEALAGFIAIIAVNAITFPSPTAAAPDPVDGAVSDRQPADHPQEVS